MALVARFYMLHNLAAISRHGRTYAAGANSIVEVAPIDVVNVDPTQAIFLTYYGATADRPGDVPGRANWPPREMYDSTLGKQIFRAPGSYPTGWVDVTGASV